MEKKKTAKEILLKLSKQNSIMGGMAKIYINDPVMAHEFILDCFSMIEKSPEYADETFTKKIVEEIRLYCYNK